MFNLSNAFESILMINQMKLIFNCFNSFDTSCTLHLRKVCSTV